MPIDILMSQLSPTMTEGKIARWLKKEGDELLSGDIMAEIETDKATMEVEVIDEGILHKIISPEGSLVPVGSVIAIVAEDGEEVPADYQPQAADTATVEVEVETPTAPAAASVETTPMPTESQKKRIKASPLARRLAKVRNLNLAQIQGSGPNGRIIKVDIEKALRSGIRLGSNHAIPPAPRPMPQGPLPYHADEYEAVENTMMRKTIARRLTESKQNIPHFYLSTEVTMDRLMDLRAQLNEAADGEFKLSVNDFILKAVSKSLIDVPETNASWTEKSTLMHKHAHVSVAVAIDGGLITPVIRHAEQKSIVEISQEVKDLAKRARAGELKPDEYTGGTFSVSNLGMFGIQSFSAIVNPPEGAILAVGATAEKVVVEDGQVVIRKIMSLTLSCDHRVVDGAVGASFLAALKQHLQRPAGLLIS
ncbi:MAG: pyruvate dehydrogenase complex dihydrolipoamide acetyltransferase [Mariprofundaceae bacterium]|nr:pyruvate dehydrogenase complex dihydrolipoamide acetyltransferase [Mariprofundaceae bacterium]